MLSYNALVHAFITYVPLSETHLFDVGVAINCGNPNLRKRSSNKKFATTLAVLF